MTYTMSREEARELLDARATRYAITFDGGPRSACYVEYAETAEQADRIYVKRSEEGGWRGLRLHKPVGMTDLAPYGRARTDAKAALDEATSILRAAVIRAVNFEGRTEVEVANEAGVDRMTVRSWLGK